ncbi:hypothetical protein [Salinicola sp. CR57]|uniref:FimV/HubP-related protein n=1 Tax=Salinicola sp. CR57 TaxID=1949086 RepID=UPI00130033A0|nr:hypothetical protein [Salinicola sp. CR57]
MRQWLTMMAGGLCLALASAAHALGVGDPQQVSPLNRPLHVVLPLSDAKGLDASRISVVVADAAAYRQAGLTRTALVDTVSTRVVRQDGGLTLVLESPNRVREPYLDLLLVVTWPEGQWQRDVSLLFDPVDYASSKPLLDGDASAESRPASTSPAPAPPPVRAVTAAPGAWPAHLPVQPGDSLSGLAASLLPRAGISRQALMVSLFQANPAAFIDGDIGRLRAGADLQVPAVDAVTGLSREDAVARLRTLAGQVRESRPVVDDPGVRPTSDQAGSAPTSQLASLEQRLAELTAESERQRTTIDALSAERDELLETLAAVPAVGVQSAATVRDDDPAPERSLAGQTPAGETGVANDPAAAAVAPVAAGRSVSDAGAATLAVSAPSVARAPTPMTSAGGSLLDHLDWVGGGLVVVLLALWGFQRRRRAKGEAPPVADDPSPKGATEAGANSAARTSPLRRAAGADLDLDSASISQADIYMAYGRYAEARDWLRQRLAEREDAQLRLGLLRALGELRDMDALEMALSGFGEDATPQQRRAGQTLVDEYRVRHVEESWQEATGDGITSDGEAGWQANVDDVDALFESQVPHAAPEIPASRGIDGIASFQAASPRSEDARFDLDATPRRPPQGDADVEEAGTRRDALAALFEDDLSAAVEASERSPLVARIEYEAPTLELATEPPEKTTPASSEARPVVDFSALSLEPMERSLEPTEHSLEIVAGPERGGRLEPTEAESFDDGEFGFRINDAASAAPRHADGAGVVSRISEEAISRRREVPADRDVEEVEFRSSHRDNGRP